MKKLLSLLSILLISLISGVTSYGKSVDESTAKTTGANFLISNGVPGVNSPADLAIVYTATAQVAGKTVVDYYVFNFVGSKGCIMVSGDDNVTPILSYSNRAGFDITNMAPATRDWIEGYQNQITYVIENNIKAQDIVKERWNDLKTAKQKVAARTTSMFPSSTAFLVQTTWDQAPGYNNVCPSCTTGCTTSGQAVTGCVATAMGQVMKFWNWPTVGCGSHTYTQNPDPNAYPAQTADYGNQAYNWNLMSLTAWDSHVDTLLYHAGVSVNMNYDPNESGSYVTESETYSSGWPDNVNCAEYALKTYFHYKRSLHGVLRDGIPSDMYTAFHIPAQAAYTLSTWTALLDSELNAGRPVLYKGQGNDGGHCWVCDGYNSTNMMHFNWGWSGTGPDGWYTVDNIAPPALGTGGGGSGNNFNTDQGVIIGIEPDSFSNYTSTMVMASHIDCQNNSAIGYDAPFTVVAKITNNGTAAFSGSYCLQVLDTANNLIATVQTLTGQTLAVGATSAALTFTTGSIGLLAMTPGQYVFRLMYQATGAKTWTAVGNNGGFINYNLVDVRLTNLIELYAAIDVTTGTTVSPNAGMWVNASVGNFGPTDFVGTVQASLINVVTGTSYIIQQHTGQTITAGNATAYSFSISSMHAPIGEYVLAVQHQPTGGSLTITGSDYYVNPVRIQVKYSAGVNTVTATADDIDVYPNPANDLINIATQGLAIDMIRISDIQGREIMKMNPDITQNVITIPVSSFAPGIYLVQMQTGTDVVTKKIVIAK